MEAAASVAVVRPLRRCGCVSPPFILNILSPLLISFSSFCLLFIFTFAALLFSRRHFFVFTQEEEEKRKRRISAVCWRASGCYFQLRPLPFLLYFPCRPRPSTSLLNGNDDVRRRSMPCPTAAFPHHVRSIQFHLIISPYFQRLLDAFFFFFFFFRRLPTDEWRRRQYDDVGWRRWRWTISECLQFGGDGRDHKQRHLRPKRAGNLLQIGRTRLRASTAMRGG